MNDNVILVISNCSDEAEADRLAHELVATGLAACVNQVPRIKSTYRWQGSVETANEVLLLIKTVTANFEALRTCLQNLHSYELPEIIAVPITQGSEPYLQWVRENSSQEPL